MKKTILIAGAVAMSLISTSCASLSECSNPLTAGCGEKVMTITENGKAKATIVVAADAPYKNQLAAKELKHFLDRISGADFVIKTDDQKVTGPKILVGRSRYTAKMKLDIPSGQSYELCRSVHAEANAIISAARRDTVGSTLYLVGRDAQTGKLLHDATSCSMCRRMIINAGISEVIIRHTEEEFDIVPVQKWVDEDDSLPEGY